MSESTTTPIHRPLYEEAPAVHRPAVQAFWDWHIAAFEGARQAEHPASWFDEQAARAEDGASLDLIPGDITERAYAACLEHRLERSDLAHQVRAAAVWSRPVQFETRADVRRFEEAWVIPHGRLLARLGDAYHSWQQPLVDHLSRAFFVTERLMRLPEDVAHGQLFLPLAELEHASVGVEDLEQGLVNEPIRQLLWRQIVRARDAYGQAQPLSTDLERPYRRAFKRWWLAGLEVLAEIERREYDLWTRPITLSFKQRVQIHLQAVVGKTTFRSRR